LSSELPDDALPSDFPPHDPRAPHSPIEREIERSERASAALAATRALARAAFTDSQLAAEDAAAQDDEDASGWVRTEYVALDHSVRDTQDTPPQPPARNLVGGSFNPGISTQQGRTYPGVSISHTPITTRGGAQATFRQESRKVPRGERAPDHAPHDPSSTAPAAHDDKPAVTPMLATVAASRGGRTNAPQAARARGRTSAVKPMTLLLAAGFGAAIALVSGGVAWKAGLLGRHATVEAAAPTPQVAAQAEAARVLSPAQPEIAIAPAAGVNPPRSDAEVNAALAAAARAAAVPADSVRAAGPARVAEPVVAVVARPAPAAPSAARAAPHGKDGVAGAIANAQARADKFLGSGNAPAQPAPEVKQEP
jgi:hypothetical protein